MNNPKSDKRKNYVVMTTFLLLGTILIVAGVSSAPLAALASRTTGGDYIDPTTQLRSPKAPAVVTADNIYIAWWTNNTENGNQEVMFRASTDSGATFSNRTNLSNTTNADSVDAEIAAEGETVIVTWWERNQTSHVPVARVSNDAGETFGPMVMLAANDTASGIDEEGATAAEEYEGEGGEEGATPEGVIEEAVGGTEVAE